jgi:hypothetical protein
MDGIIEHPAKPETDNPTIETIDTDLFIQTYAASLTAILQDATLQNERHER